MRGRKIKWRKRALADLREFHDWLAQTENGRPKQTVRRIRLAVETMARLGDIGRPSIEPGLRELSVKNAPYVVVYRVDAGGVEVLAVYHMSQDR